MTGAINLAKRDYPDQTVVIEPYPQVYWHPINQILAVGMRRKYSRFQQPTRSRLWSPLFFDKPWFEFHPNNDPIDTINALRQFTTSHLIPKVLDMANETDILRKTQRNIKSGGANPEKCLAISIWQNRTVDLDHVFQSIFKELEHDQFKNSFTEFYDTVHQSEDIAQLLASKSN